MAKRVPIRRCIVTREMLPKNQLLRVVRNKENQPEIDLLGKKEGRGAYIKKDLKIIDIAKKKNSFKYALKINIREEFYEKLKDVIEK